MTLRAAVAALTVETALLALGAGLCWRWLWRRANKEAAR